MDFLLPALPATVALAVVAVIGYMVGRARREKDGDLRSGSARRELKRAKAVIHELETIAQDIRTSLATHHSSILQFRERVETLGHSQDSASWQELSEEAERMLAPTQKLATHMASAYDEIRRQTNMLMTFTEVRTDPLTGLSNRRALDESLDSMLALQKRYGNNFSIGIFDIDFFKQVNDEHGHLHGDQILKSLAALFDHCARETDVVTRFGGEEFVVIMPETDLEGGCCFGERMRQLAESKATVTLSCGIAAANKGDSPKSLLSRADSALYAAKAAGRNCVFQHTGDDILSASVEIEPEEIAALVQSADHLNEPELAETR